MTYIQLRTALPGPKSLAALERRKNALPNGLAKSTDIAVEKAEGALVWDLDGNQLLDFAGGIGMINIGHRNEKVVEAIRQQLDKYIHTCSLVTTMEPYLDLAELLNSLTPGDFPKKTLLANSGSEAVENAVNIAKYYTKRNAILCFEGAYHGRTLLTLSLTSKYSLFKKGFGSYVSDIYRIPAPNLYRKTEGLSDEQYIQSCIRQLEHAFVSQVDPESLAAIIIEPVQGEGGFNVVPRKYLTGLREICDKYGILLILDEVQSGFGRTGKWAAYQHYDVIPDLSVWAKSMGSGMPIGAVLGKAAIMDACKPSTIGGTYPGNPVCCAASLATLNYMEAIDINALGQRVGAIVRTRFEIFKQKFSAIGDVRGLGAMMAFELVKDKDPFQPDGQLCKKLITWCADHGLILISAGVHGNVIRILSPLVIEEALLQKGLDIIEAGLTELTRSGGL